MIKKIFLVALFLVGVCHCPFTFAYYDDVQTEECLASVEQQAGHLISTEVPESLNQFVAHTGFNLDDWLIDHGTVEYKLSGYSFPVSRKQCDPVFDAIQQLKRDNRCLLLNDWFNYESIGGSQSAWARLLTPMIVCLYDDLYWALGEDVNRILYNRAHKDNKIWMNLDEGEVYFHDIYAPNEGWFYSKPQWGSSTYYQNDFENTYDQPRVGSEYGEWLFGSDPTPGWSSHFGHEYDSESSSDRSKVDPEYEERLYGSDRNLGQLAPNLSETDENLAVANEFHEDTIAHGNSSPGWNSYFDHEYDSESSSDESKVDPEYEEWLYGSDRNLGQLAPNPSETDENLAVANEFHEDTIAHGNSSPGWNSYFDHEYDSESSSDESEVDPEYEEWLYGSDPILGQVISRPISTDNNPSETSEIGKDIEVQEESTDAAVETKKKTVEDSSTEATVKVEKGTVQDNTPEAAVQIEKKTVEDSSTEATIKVKKGTVQDNSPEAAVQIEKKTVEDSSTEATIKVKKGTVQDNSPEAAVQIEKKTVENNPTETTVKMEKKIVEDNSTEAVVKNGKDTPMVKSTEA